MKSLLRLVTVVALLVFARLDGAGNAAPSAYTAKEIAQGFSDRTVLAKPRADAIAEAETQERSQGTRVRETFARLGELRVIDVPEGTTVDATISRLRATGQYEFVERDVLMSADATTPNDPNFTLQWALNNTGTNSGGVAFADIDATRAWDLQREAPNVIVAMIDGGVRLDHQDIAPNLWRNASPTFGDVNGARIIRGVRSGDVADENGHGTHTAGIVGAQGNNGVATAGVAWRVQLMILKNAGADGASSASDSAALVDYAVSKGAHVINCSFGGTTFSQTLYNALRAARDAGVIVVCSAGNSGLNNDLNPHYPSNYLLDNIVSVGNSTPTDAASSSSNYGASVDLFAPGTNILSTDWTTTNGAISHSGSSMAAPHVTGTLALLKARFPNETYRQLINRVLRTAESRSGLVGRAITNGRLYSYAALAITVNRPANDDFLTRQLMTGSFLALRSNNRGATTETGEPGHGVTGASGSLWWQWIAPVNGTIVLDTNGSDFDTVLAVYTGPAAGTAVTGLTSVTTNDNNGSNQTSRVTFTAVSGTSYFFALSGKNNSQGYAQLNLAVAPANDNFADAATLSGDSAQATGRNLAASLETGEPRILNIAGGASLWYKWTAPRTTRYQVSAFSYFFDSILAVYTGSALNNLTLVTSNDDTSPASDIVNLDSRCTFNATAGTTYYFQVDTTANALRGDVVVSVTDSRWQFSTGDYITTSPAVATDGTIYIGSVSPDRRVYALTPEGALKWSYVAGGSLDIGSVAIATDGTIYQGASGGKFVALTPAGAVRWTRDFGASVIAAVSPAIAADGTIYLPTTDGYLNALNPADGSTRWRYNVNLGSTYASPAIAPDGTIYQPSFDQGLYAINPDGTLKWRFAMGSDSFASPALDASGNIYVTTYTTPRLISVAPDGTQRWSYSGATSFISGSATLSADGTTAYFGSSDRRLHAVDTTTGGARWTYTTGSSILASTPAVDSAGNIYIGSYDGKLYSITSAGSLRRSWDTAQPIRSSPVIFGTTLYVASMDSKLYAFDISASAAGGPWPQYRHNARRLGRAFNEPLAVTVAPAATNTNVGGSATFRVVATGQGPLTFQWRRDGVAIPGATLATYTLNNADVGLIGDYTVVVSGPQGSVTSSAGFLSLGPVSTAGRLINLSILTSISSAGDNFTMGYVVGGNNTGGPKPLVLRAAGPSLGAIGVPGTLDDPKLELFTGSTKTGENDNWGGAATLASAMAAVGAFPYSAANSRDAAAVASITTRDNSVKVSAAGNGTGTVIAEIYDATAAANFTTTTPRLLNVSVLKNIGTGLTAGFVIGGSSPKTVLIRAIGPTLGAAPFGVPGVVADPQLTLFGAASARLEANDNWGGTAALSSAFTAVGAFPLAADSRDAAILATLPPGSYSVEVKGAGTTTGIALVEVYEVP